MLREGQVYPAVIEGYASGGEGVARVEGMAVFVKGAIRGERAGVFIEHIGHSAAWGRVHELLEPSPARTEPDCPYYGVCGGCQFRHMTYEEELESKRRRVEDALRRIGGVDVPVSVIHGAKNTRHYRNKVQFPVADGHIGYYQGRTHRVVDIADCLLQPEIDTVCRAAVKSWMERFRVPAYDERTGKGLIRHLFLRTNALGEALCCLVVSGKTLPYERELVEALRAAAPSLAGVVLSVNRKRTNVILGSEYRLLWGRDWLEETLCGLTFRLSAPSFFQVNREQAEVLYTRAVELAGLTGRETVLDLYCGTGTITLAMARRAMQAVGAEIVPEAIANAIENARLNSLENARFFQGDAGAVAKKLAEERLRPHVIVVDPPRKGLSPEVVDAIAGMRPDRVVYVSCDPATLARDVKRFGPLGYVPVTAESFDLFPRTAHVESALLLSNKNASGG